ncbi:kinase-like domain-containing protein [Rhizophagus clarus]|uniref:Kinase-like domain-containing protein n=1 Tax=Rhizophagus clarus TaxID=94130 RepID=A0A8H3MFT1_9GLOM|nr:kinase-like domain-containing protein [Rhizophagus clarus]
MEKISKKNDFFTIYSAIWKDGPLYWNNKNKEYIRNSNEIVALKYLKNNKNEKFLKKALKEYSIRKFSDKVKVYGISQDPNTKDYIIFKDIVKSNYNKTYSAIWNDGPLHYNLNEETDEETEELYVRESHKNVALKYICKSRNISLEYLKKIVKEYSIKKFENNVLIYGLTQNTITKDYFMVLDDEYFGKYCAKCYKMYTNPLYEWCKPCQLSDLKKNFTNHGDEKIDDLIRKMQLKINDPQDIIFEWIPYDQFNDIKEVRMGNLATAIWKDGPLRYSDDIKEKRYIREPDKHVTLKYLNNVTIKILNKVLKEYSIKRFSLNIYGISQNPITKDYIMVLNNKYFVKHCARCVCSAIWKNGPLCYNLKNQEYTRNPNERVALKYLGNSQNISDNLNEILKEYSIKKFDLNIYGITKNPITKDYFMVLDEKYFENYCVKCENVYTNIPCGWCRPCQIDYLKNNFKNWTSGNEKINNSIQEMQLKIHDSSDIVFEWIPFEQFDDIERIGKGGFAIVYSAIWKDGPLNYCKDKNDWIRDSNKKIALKCLENSQNITDEFLNEVRAYSINSFDKILKVYGISQHPDTKDYIIVLQYAEDMGLCGEIGNIDEECIYGVMPYIAPEVLRATERQPFSSCAHDHHLALDICKGIRPEIYEPEAPKCYINLMKRCWDSNPDNRPNAAEIEKLIISFYNSYCPTEIKRGDDEINEQFKEAEKYRRTANNKTNKPTIHVEAVFTSRLLNSFTQELKILSEILEDNILDKSECLDCEIYKQ